MSMDKILLCVCVFLAATGIAVAASSQDYSRQTGETNLSFATRALRLSKDADPHVTSAAWAGHTTLFVDYQTAGDDAERPIVALQQQPHGEYREIQVTVGEQEGGVPDLVALGFAKASHDHDTDLIVIMSWAQQHAGVSGTLYDVRMFGPPHPGQNSLPLLKISKKFGLGCDCKWSDGTSKHYRFKTIAAVKAALKHLGY